MLSYLYKNMSLNNLPKSRPSGQIATLLILIMVVVLIFILVTVNIGQLSITATNLANTADSASLSLASQLGTKSRMLWIANGNRVEKCQKTSLVGVILSVVIAIVAIIVAPYLAAPALGFGAAGTATGISTATIAGVTVASGNAAIVAGAIGGAIGGGVGSGTWKGALQGAAIGAGIGYGVAAVPGPTTIYAGIGAPLEASGAFSAALLVPASQAAVAAGVGMVALGAAAIIYNASVADRESAAQKAAAAKALNGLPENDRIRESVFLQALSQTIDDPNTIQDIFDSDEDGDVSEKIPYFQYWWDMRIADFKDNVNNLKRLIDEFLNGRMVNARLQAGPLKAFEEFAKTQYSDGGSLDRVELRQSEGNPEHSDGILVQWARALENAGYDVSFWQPGVPPARNPECETCDADYHDAIDRAALTLKEIAGSAETLRLKTLDQLAISWEDWIKFFYDSDTTGDYYDTLSDLVNGSAQFKGLTAWKQEIRAKRLLLPECTYGPGQVNNPPCRIISDRSHPYPGTINEQADDEFDPALDAITTIINRIGEFRTAARNFYNNMKAAASRRGSGTAYGGTNPVTYAWTDSRGGHSVKAETHFTVPRMKSYKKGPWYKRKICLGIIDYSGSPSVEITRSDPVNKNVGILGKWNPFFNGKVVRKSIGSYSFDKVTMKGIR